MNNYQIINGSFTPHMVRKSPIATHDNRIIAEEPEKNMASYLIGTPKAPVDRGATYATSIIYHQAPLLAFLFPN